MEIHLTDNAMTKVRAFASSENDADGKGLRIYVQGGGCSGFQYGFAFDQPKEGDTVIEKEEVRVLVDTYSAPYLRDSTVDYVDSLQGSGFVVQNPNAKGTCGCGISFTV